MQRCYIRNIDTIEENRILIPVDFSDCSNNAIDYALPIAEKINADIILLHTKIKSLCLRSVAPLLVFPSSDFYYKKIKKSLS